MKAKMILYLVTIKNNHQLNGMPHLQPPNSQQQEHRIPQVKITSTHLLAKHSRNNCKQLREWDDVLTSNHWSGSAFAVGALSMETKECGDNYLRILLPLSIGSWSLVEFLPSQWRDYLSLSLSVMLLSVGVLDSISGNNDRHPYKETYYASLKSKPLSQHSLDLHFWHHRSTSQGIHARQWQWQSAKQHA